MRLLLFLIIAASYAISSTQATPPDQSALRSLDNVPVIHFTIHRRHGAFAATPASNDFVDLDYLVRQLEVAERRFNLTKREVSGNKLVRKAKTAGGGGREGTGLMGDIASDGAWYARIGIGQPPQEIDMDLNMLASDFYVVKTSSKNGNSYDDFFSNSITKSPERPYPACTLPNDEFHFPTINASVSLSFAYCRPQKFTRKTLGASGSILGLAASKHLAQTKSGSLIAQLMQNKVIERPIFSLMLLNGQEGVLSIGGTGAPAVDMVIKQTQDELDQMGALERGEVPLIPTKDDVVAVREGKPLTKRSRAHTQSFETREASWNDGWELSTVQGAEGWWQILMQGVWVDGSRVLQNQAVVVDINCPFILAPPLAAKAFYASISGSHPLPAPHSSFYVFPCLNPPTLHFEFGTTKFQAMHGGRGADWTGVPGGRFSLGRLNNGSGYCVGSVVETRMGIREERDEMMGETRNELRMAMQRGGMGGNGMRDVWVIGEGFFRGVSAVFDLHEQKVGFRTS